MATGNYPSEHVLVCGSVILQRDKSVKKGADIRRLLQRQITLWQQVILIYCFRRQRDVIGPFSELGIVHQVRNLLFEYSPCWSFRGN